MLKRNGVASRLLAVAVTALLAAGPASAASKKDKSAPGSRLEGVVRAADGKSPAKGAIVEVRPLGGGAPIRSAPADRKGRFKMQGLPYGWAEVIVTGDGGDFLGDQAVNLPPGSKVVVNLTLLAHADRPESWWSERALETPSGLTDGEVAGLAQSSQKLTGVEYWKSPKGMVILITAGVAALAVIAAGGRNYTAP